MKFFLLLTFFTASFLPANDPTLSAAEREFAMAYLSKTKQQVLDLTAGLSAAQLNFKTAPDRWSIAECAEHIALAETGLYQRLEASLQAAAEPEKRQEIKVSDEQVIQILTNRTGKAQSPEIIKPTGKFPSTAVAMAAFAAQREQLITLVKESQADFRHHFFLHPATGTVDDYQMILLIAAHSERHYLQMEEVKANADFPK